MRTGNAHPAIGLPARIGAACFLLWAVLHLWVGYAGVAEYLSGVDGQWAMLLGGVNAPKDAFQYPSDPITANAQAHLLLNFCLDVMGYGVLGLFVAWMIWRRGSWIGYLIGAIVIGIGDLAFLFCLVTPGIIEANLPTIAGPVLWFLAVLITPFGMPREGGRWSRPA